MGVGVGEKEEEETGKKGGTKRLVESARESCAHKSVSDATQGVHNTHSHTLTLPDRQKRVLDGQIGRRTS